MLHGNTVIDVHGHHSTPAHFRAYAYNFIALRTAMGSSLQIPEKAMEGAQAFRVVPLFEG